MPSDGGCLVSGDGGGGGTCFVIIESMMEGIEGRDIDAGAEGCENGLPGPFGASP